MCNYLTFYKREHLAPSYCIYHFCSFYFFVLQGEFFCTVGRVFHLPKLSTCLKQCGKQSTVGRVFYSICLNCSIYSSTHLLYIISVLFIFLYCRESFPFTRTECLFKVMWKTKYCGHGGESLLLNLNTYTNCSKNGDTVSEILINKLSHETSKLSVN